ncbi:outer membrane lipoprotein carrier protein LolA [Gemmatimonas aurantiaca]|uniref:LolA family protein n=1 Tax=Gemmatimonas aurantiaca TaxID=173480 RepID=UPI00301C7316
MSMMPQSISASIVTAVTAALSATVITVGAAQVQAQNPADASYDRVAKAWAGTHTLRADFEQKISNPLLARTVNSKGVFLQERPGKVSITFSQPAGDRIVGDGKWLWVYLPSSAPGQVLKMPADADGAVVADLLSQLLDTPKRSFTISGGEVAPVDGRDARRVQLVPKTAGTVPFQKAVLWLDDKDPRPLRVQVIDAQGVDRSITLTSWTPGASIAADAFRFTVPKGVKVAERP